MRVYKQMEFYPENKPLEERLKSQYYNVFAGYSECVFRKSNIDKKTSQKYKTIWESLMTNMLGSREAMIIWNHVVAFKIKHPALNKPFGIIMKGLQGEGKNWSLSRLAKIVGYLTTSKVSDVLGEHAMGMFRKIIVNLDEMDLNNTKITYRIGVFGPALILNAVSFAKAREHMVLFLFPFVFFFFSFLSTIVIF